MAIRSFFAKSRAARSANGRPDDVTNEREVEITPAMMEAGVIAYYDAPEWAKDGELPEGAVKRIYSAMEAARFAGSGAALRPLRNEFGPLDHLDCTCTNRRADKWCAVHGRDPDQEYERLRDEET